MFGFVAANPAMLTKERFARYKECYCGLCHALKDRYGFAAKLGLTYDMTFLVLLLNSLYEPAELHGEARCSAHPLSRRGYWQSEISDYAADMNVLLAYLNCRDDWQDDMNVLKLAEARALNSNAERILLMYPRQAAAVKAGMSELDRIEKSRVPAPDAAAAAFGGLMAELYVWKEDRWSGRLRALGMALGKFIYIMDACIDLRSDKRYYKYNPLLDLYGRIDEEERFREILEMLMADCVRSFDALPLVRDADILKNILCFGVWNKFNKHYNIKGAVPDGTRPL